MKKSPLMYILAAGALFSVGACRADRDIIIDPAPQGVTAVCAMLGTVEFTKAALDTESFVFQWEAGDSVLMVQHPSDTLVSKASALKLRTSDYGTEAAFSGELQRDSLPYFNKYSQVCFISNPTLVSPGPVCDTVTVKALQSGDAEDFHKWFVCASASATPVQDAGTLRYDNVSMSPLFPAVKLSFGQDVDVVNLSMRAYDSLGVGIPISGRMVYNPSDVTTSVVEESSDKDIHTPSDETEQLPRTLYFSLMPQRDGVTYIDSLRFRFVRSDGIIYDGIADKKGLKLSGGPLLAGEIRDLGVLESIPYPSLDTLPKASFAIKKAALDGVMTASVKGATKLYYTSAKGSEPADPDSGSAEYPSGGLELSCPASDDLYVKVLATAEGYVSSLSVFHLRYFRVNSDAVAITVNDGATAQLGFLTLTPKAGGATLQAAANSTYYTNKTGQDFTYSFTTSRNADGRFYIQLRKQTKAVWLNYDGQQKNTAKLGTTYSYWDTNSYLNFAVEAGKTVDFVLPTNDTNIFGFAWLEQNF